MKTLAVTGRGAGAFPSMHYLLFRAASASNLWLRKDSRSQTSALPVLCTHQWWGSLWWPMSDTHPRETAQIASSVRPFVDGPLIRRLLQMLRLCSHVLFRVISWACGFQSSLMRRYALGLTLLCLQAANARPHYTYFEVQKPFESSQIKAIWYNLIIFDISA